jgi:large subunit ribosomal protein L21
MNQEEKFVVHNSEKEIAIPAKDENLFAVIHFKGLQHKVIKNDVIILEKIPLEVGQTFVFDKIMLIGTTDYTSLGRPYISSAKVLANVEQQTLSEKVIIFKKQRRKGYQKNQSHRQEITVVRILKILHNPPQEFIDNYSTL